MEEIPSLLLSEFNQEMAQKVINIFVDESGNFGDAGDKARFCIVTFVLSEEGGESDRLIEEYKRGVYQSGADPDSMVFHAGPLIRQEEQFSAMSRNMRGRIFYQMLSLVRKLDLRYRSFCIDTAFVSSLSQIALRLKESVADFFGARRNLFDGVDGVNDYYDAGQKSVTRILEAVDEVCPCSIEHIFDLHQSDSIMLQVADFICMTKLIDLRIAEGIPFNRSELKFFGSPRDFKRNVLRKIATKELV